MEYRLGGCGYFFFAHSKVNICLHLSGLMDTYILIDTCKRYCVLLKAYQILGKWCEVKWLAIVSERRNIRKRVSLNFTMSGCLWLKLNAHNKCDKYSYQKSKDIIVTVKKVTLGNLITPPFGVKVAFLVQRSMRLGWPSAINELHWNLGFVLLLGS